MNKKSGRYSVSPEEDYENGSNGEVLKNKLEIKTRHEIEMLEESELIRAELELMEQYGQNQRFTSKDICHMHNHWLQNIYYFAGKYRTINMSKNGYDFAPAIRIQPLMHALERDYLAKYTPCHFTDTDEFSSALGIVHVEFILIHPFREGNGRVARLLADLMAIQANKPLLNYQSIDQINQPEGFENYILAIHAGHAGNYEPIKRIFKKIVADSSA